MRPWLFAALLLGAAPAVAAASPPVEAIEQRVQEALTREGISLAEHGYTLRLTSTASTTVVVQLLRHDGGDNAMRIVEGVPEDLDAAVQEIGLVVVGLLPTEHTHGAEAERAPAPPRDLETKSMDTPATSVGPARFEPGNRLSEDDRYYLGLAFAWAVGFGSGQFIAGAPRGWLYAVFDTLATATGTAGVIFLVQGGDRRDLGLGLLIGGGSALVLGRIFQVIDLLAFGADSGALAVLPVDGGPPALGWAMRF